MRAGVVLAVVLLLGGCRTGSDAAPPVVHASEPVASETAADAREARLAALRATDQFDEFAGHERAAQADGARLAWENFAPIMDGERVEWTNKAELWDEIAPRIRDEALLLGPEYRQPLWDNTNAIPNSVSMTWNDEDTAGRGDYAEFGVTLDSADGPAEFFWGVLIRRNREGHGTAVRSTAFGAFSESAYPSSVDAFEARRDKAWEWIFSEAVA